MNEKHERNQQSEFERMITDAEWSRANIFKPPGGNEVLLKSFHTKMISEMDDDFFHYSAHIDNTLVQKIEKGEYVDLAKLLPKEKLLFHDGRMRMIQKEGSTFLEALPVTEKDPSMITSLRKWEQAFEIYATIYTSAHPSRSAELFKHMYNIRSAAATFTWNNVYNYDVTFRRLME